MAPARIAAIRLMAPIAMRSWIRDVSIVDDFEDSVTDFGQLDTEHVDLAKLLVMEFTLVFGNNWFTVPVPVIGISGAPGESSGMLSRVTTLTWSNASLPDPLPQRAPSTPSRGGGR